MPGSAGSILERAFERARRPFTDGARHGGRCRGSRQHNLEDMLAAVGRGEIPSANVVKAVYPDHKEERPSRRRPDERGGLVRPPRVPG